MANYFATQDAIALAAATAKSVLELATPAGQRCWIKEWWVDFDGVSGTAVPVHIEVGRFSAAVTTASAVTENKMDPADGTPTVVAQHTTSTEGAGTAVDVLHKRISPTTGFHYIAPLGEEMVIAVSSFWRMRLTAPAAVNATVGVVWRE